MQRLARLGTSPPGWVARRVFLCAGHHSLHFTWNNSLRRPVKEGCYYSLVPFQQQQLSDVSSTVIPVLQQKKQARMGYTARKRESQDLNPRHPAPEHEMH